MEPQDIQNLLISVANNAVSRITQILPAERTEIEQSLYREASAYLTKVFETYGRILGNLPPGLDGKGRTE